MRCGTMYSASSRCSSGWSAKRRMQGGSSMPSMRTSSWLSAAAAAAQHAARIATLPAIARPCDPRNAAADRAGGSARSANMALAPGARLEHEVAGRTSGAARPEVAGSRGSIRRRAPRMRRARDERVAAHADGVDLVDEDDALAAPLARRASWPCRPGTARRWMSMPMNICAKPEPGMVTNGELKPVAMAFASIVLPVPGGPRKSRPRSGLPPAFLNSSPACQRLIMRVISCLASAWPRTCSSLTPQSASPGSYDLDLADRHQQERPEQDADVREQQDDDLQIAVEQATARRRGCEMDRLPVERSGSASRRSCRSRITGTPRRSRRRSGRRRRGGTCRASTRRGAGRRRPPAAASSLGTEQVRPRDHVARDHVDEAAERGDRARGAEHRHPPARVVLVVIQRNTAGAVRQATNVAARFSPRHCCASARPSGDPFGPNWTPGRLWTCWATVTPRSTATRQSVMPLLRLPEAPGSAKRPCFTQR